MFVPLALLAVMMPWRLSEGMLNEPDCAKQKTSTGCSEQEMLDFLGGNGAHLWKSLVDDSGKSAKEMQDAPQKYLNMELKEKGSTSGAKKMVQCEKSTGKEEKISDEYPCKCEAKYCFDETPICRGSSGCAKLVVLTDEQQAEVEANKKELISLNKTKIDLDKTAEKKGQLMKLTDENVIATTSQENLKREQVVPLKGSRTGYVDLINPYFADPKIKRQMQLVRNTQQSLQENGEDLFAHTVVFDKHLTSYNAALFQATAKLKQFMKKLAEGLGKERLALIKKEQQRLFPFSVVTKRLQKRYEEYTKPDNKYREDNKEMVGIEKPKPQQWIPTTVVQDSELDWLQSELTGSPRADVNTYREARKTSNDGKAIEELEGGAQTEAMKKWQDSTEEKAARTAAEKKAVDALKTALTATLGAVKIKKINKRPPAKAPPKGMKHLEE